MARRGRGAELNALRNKKKDEKTGSTQRSQSSVSTNRNGGGRTGGLTKQEVRKKVSNAPGYTSQGKAQKPISSTTRQKSTTTSNYTKPQSTTHRSRINGSVARGREQAQISRGKTYAIAAEMRKAREEEQLKRNPAPTAKQMLAQRQDKAEAQKRRESTRMRNAAEWEEVKNKSKEEQQEWLTNKAKAVTKSKGTDNLATSAALAGAHSAKGALHSLAGAIERGSMNDTQEAVKLKFDAMRKGMSSEDADKYANETAKRRQEARLAGFRAKSKLEQEKVEAIKEKEAAKDSGPIPLRKMAVGAASFTGQRVVDTVAMGPYSLISMGARVLEDERNSGKEKTDKLKQRLADSGQFTQEELDREFSKIDRRTTANAYASSGIEILSELMFGGIGLSKKYLPEGMNGLLDRAAGKVAGKLGSTALGRVALGIGEETAEEWIANPIQAYVSNRLAGNRMQELQEESVRRAYQSQANDLKELQATSADINSEAFLERAKEIYKESGANDEEATRIAELARDYFNAEITGDATTAEEKMNQITDILAGGENDQREKWTLRDALEVAGEMILSVGAEATPGAISTAQTGSLYKSNYGLEGVKKLAKVVENLDEAKSDRAKAIVDDIENGKDISNTQVAMLMEWSNAAAQKAKEREAVRDQVVQKKMADENLFVPIVDAEYNLAPATEERFETITERVADLAQDYMGMEISDVDAYAIGDVVAAYQTGTISAEQMNELNIENPVAREVFRRATGIDLDQYNVKDSKGNIKEAASNTAMQKALFAKAADNYMKSARIEQENWNDVERGRAYEELTSNMDGLGGVGIQRVLESVDPRNRSEFMLAGSVARRVYEHARNTNDDWDTVKKDFTRVFGAGMNESMRYVFDMAKQAKEIAENKYYGKQVSPRSSVGDTVVAEGKFVNESARELKGSEIGILTSVASELGINVTMTDSLDQNENGRYMPKARSIMLNSANTMGDNLEAIFSHEVTHHLAAYAPEEYIKLSRFVMDRWYKSNPEEYNSEIKRIQDLYKKAKDQDLSPEEALEELIADGSRDFWSDEEFINQVTTEEPSLAKSIINAIKDFLGKLRNILASGNITGDMRDGFFAEINAYDDAYKLWLNAYNAARINKANEAIDEWQDEANKQNEVRNSISPEYTQEEMDAHRQYLIDSAAESYEDPFTEDINESGFILPNGRLPRMGIYGSRADDHNLVVGAYDDIGYDTSQHPKADAMARFLNEGNIRYMPENGSIELGTEIEPTYEQYARIREMDYVDMIEFTSPDGETVEYKEYDGDRSGVVNDIKRFYRDGEIGGSQTAMFRYSIAPTIEEFGEGNNAMLNGKPFWSGSANALDGYIEEVHSYAEAENVDWHHSMYFSPEQVDKIDDEENVFFWVDTDGSIQTEWRNGEASQKIINSIRAQIVTRADARFSISEETRADIEEKGVDITESGTAVRYSYNSWADTDKEELLKKLVSAGFDKAAAEKWIDDVNSVSAIIYGDMARLNYEADSYQDALKPNSEYFYTLDLSTLCQKRRLYQGNYNAIMRHLVHKALHPEDTVRLREMMEEMGLETPCGICYEESRKKNEGKFAETWLNGETDSQWKTREKAYQKNLEKYQQKLEEYNALEDKGNKKAPNEPKKPERWMGYKNMEHDDPYIPTLADVTTTDGRAELRKNHPEALEAYLEYQKGRGSANPKVSFTHTDYRRDILRMTKNDVANVKHIGGLRIQSFSDFESIHVIDVMQAIMDMSTLKLTSQAYTKVPAFADIFGGTGVKINLSLIQKMDENGNPVYEEYTDKDGKKKKRLVFDSKEGIDPGEAFRIREKYSKNVGTILVGVSKQQILDAWADDRVDMVIPFHRSGWSIKEFERLGLKGYEDFQEFQSEKYFDPKTKEWITMKAAKMEELYSIDYWDSSKSGKENAERYLQLCAEQHRRPVFFNFLHDNGDGTWSLQEDGSTDGYWKSLIDYKMYDNDGNFAPQEEVKPVFDMKAAEETLRIYEGDADTLPVNKELVEAYLKDYKKRHPRTKIDFDGDVRLSLAVDIDDQYMSALESDSWEGTRDAWRLIGEAAKTAGFTKKVYHGTPVEERFYKFADPSNNIARHSGGSGFIYATTDLEYADIYAHHEDEDGYITDGNVMSGYINPDNMLDIGTVDNAAFRPTQRTLKDGGKAYDRNWPGYYDEKSINERASDNLKSLAKAIGKTPYELMHIFDESTYSEVGEGTGALYDFVNRPAFADYVKEEGYDGIKLSEFGNESYGLLESNQFKSAELITYAEDGSVIPLSQRFDPNNDDIRYSLPTQDSDGNILTDGQMEYFKDSQARNTEGKMAVVYHTTKKGGFTVFDPWFSDDKRSLFFSDRFEVSQTYASNADRPIDYESGALREEAISAMKEDAQAIVNKISIKQSNFVDVGDETVATSFDIFVKGEAKTDGEWHEISYKDTISLSEDQYKEADDPEDVDDAIQVLLGDAEYLVSDLLGVDIEYMYQVESFGDPYSLDIDYEPEEGADIIDEEGAYLRPDDYGYSNDVLLNQRGYYTCYLNLENPLIIDGRGNNWNNISNPALGIIDREWVMYTDGFGEQKVAYSDNGGLPVEITDKEAQDLLGWDLYDKIATWWFQSDYGSIKTKWDTIENKLGNRSTTREIAEYAAANGYDGVILRNIADVNRHIKNPFSDIYIAFRSEQVKDIHNENPTDDPDIRFSIPSEDETMTYAQTGAKNTDNLWYTDPVLHEGAVRYSVTKQDFINGKIDKWNPAWKTEGHVLKESSVRKAIRGVVMGAMRGSTSGAKYRQKTVDETMLVARKAFDMMKSDEYAKAAGLIYGHAYAMIEDLEFFGSEDESEFQRYKDLRDYLRTTKITVPEDRRNDIDYEAFRKRNFRKILLGNDGIAPDEVWQHLNELWPEAFSEDIKGDIPGIMLQIENALDIYQPYAEAYTSEQCVEFAGDIADSLWDIIYEGEEYKSLADKYDAKMQAMKQRHQEAMLKVKENYKEKLTKQALDAKRREYAKLDAQKEKYKQKIADLKTEYKAKKGEAVKQQKLRSEKQIARLKANRKEADAKRKERQMHRQLYNRILKEYKDLSHRLLNPTKDKAKNIPEQLRQPLAQMLYCFDLEKTRSKKLEEMYMIPTRAQLNFRELKDAMAQVVKEDPTAYEISDMHKYLEDKMTDLAGRVDRKTIDALDIEDLNVIKDLLVGLNAAIKNGQQVEIDGENYQKQEQCNKLGEGVVEHQKIYGKAKTYSGLRKITDNIVNMGELTPIYFFRQIPGMYDMYRQLRLGFDEYVKNESEIIDKIATILAPYYKTNRKGQRVQGSEIEKWRHSESAETFDLITGDQTITLTIAQKMSLYCLAKRSQAQMHMYSENGGIVASETTAGSKMNRAKEWTKGKNIEYNSVVLTPADVDTIVASLTEEQKEIADKLQALMSKDMSVLGNRASVKLTGIEMYKEENYFPIKVQGDSRPTDLDNIGIREKIRNPGFSNPLQENAQNPIIVDDIFTVVSKHCNEMNQYASYAVPITSFMKVYNGSVLKEDGKPVKVKTLIRETYGDRAIEYIENFINDINGNSFKRMGGLDDVIDTAIGQAKKAAVFANLRVAAQQPTAIVRSFAVINAKYFAGVRPSVKATREMFEHCPIAKWKSWGYYDTHFGRDIEDVMMGKNVSSKADYFMTEVYGALDNMTWGMIWQAVKKEVLATHDVKEGSEEFWKLCNERASFVFDSTQVVDSPFHRSNDMRSKNGFVKQLTSFQSEPTLSFNVLRQGIVDAIDAAKRGNKSKAIKVLRNTMLVWVGQAATVALAQSIVDALRRKGHKADDDDEDEALTWYQEIMKYFRRNYLKNFFDDVNPINNIYYFKEIIPGILNVLTGEYDYGQSNLAFQWVETLKNGISMCKKKWEKGDAYNKTWYDCITEVMGGLGYLAGLPAKTVMRGAKNVVHWFNKLTGLNVFASDGTEPDEEEKKSLQIPGIEDGSFADNILNKIGINLSDSEKAAAIQAKKDEEFAKKREEIKEKVLDLTGEEKEHETWKRVSKYVKETEGMTFDELVNAGDYATINRYRNMYLAAGNSEDYFDQQIYDKSKSAFKKTIIYDPTAEQIETQMSIKNYLTSHGMNEAELSEIAYKSETKKDFQVACRLGDEDAIVESLIPLLRAGMSREDIIKAYDNRNRAKLETYKGRYKDKLKSTGTFIWPTQGTVTSRFGYRGNDPTLPAGASTNHPSIDIGASTGTPVVAADGGVIIYTGYNGGYGNSVGIRHDNGMVTYYNHLHAWNVKVGDTVSQGQQIAQVGNTGTSSGSHLDFKILDTNGKPVDPEKYLH